MNWFSYAVALAFTAGGASFGAEAKMEGSPVPPMPAIKSLRLEPSTLTLKDGRDERRVLVLGKTEAGKVIDLTPVATLKSESAAVEVDGQQIRAKAVGEGTIRVSAAGREAKLTVKVDGASMPPVRFVRDVEPFLSKSGCNAGTCHGSAKGKNGFKLSLRGYDPEFDYQALINDLSGRRFNRVKVEESLMLLKPTGEVPHEGRQAIKPKSREYELIRQWIAEGAQYEDPKAGRANKIEILPAEVEIDLPGRTHQLLVIARYADGSERDVTRESVFESSNSEVAEIKDSYGAPPTIKAVRRGEAAILVRYEGLYSARQVTVMGDRTGFEWVETPEYNYIDKLVHAKLKKVKVLPSEVCTDAEFARRIYLDLTGLPPSLEATRAFLDDKSDGRGKRERLVDELIGSRDFVKRWANKWADLLQCNSENLGQKGVWLFREWIEQCVAENKPYDKMVRELLTAEGSCYQNPAVNYLRVLREPGKITEDVSQTFLGVRFNCNKCHDHPFEKWTQNQYYEFGAYFAQVSIKRGFLGREVIRNNTGDATPVTGEEIVYRNYAGGELKHPKTDMAVAPKVPFGEAKTGGEDPREPLVDWLTSKENPLFAKSMANRVWSYFLGKGIIDPVDDIRASNPASNPELLEALTEDFVKGGFDTRKLMRTICVSRTYQLSIAPNKWNEDDRINFSHALPRRLSAEQMFDAVMIATGTRPNFNGMPQGMRAMEVPDGNVKGDDFLALFGRPKRMSACECERTSNITLSHALSMINGVTISDAINKGGSRIAKIVEANSDDRKVLEEIYLACLNRLPSEKEAAAIDLTVGPRLEVAQDVAWALINSPAFLFNR